MADEFMKGFGILVTAGLGWLVVAGWYKTPSFQGPQLLGTYPEDPGVYTQIAIALGEGLFYFAILGALAFWVLIPVINQAREAYAERK
ncbi:hypothetical protein HLRTI_002833 [Halorhabdus tiamatea SARL4B]|uniref:DUF7314 domain-containing protein n=1 Tax=Halorhabdus tiamatea SARL4B TaxID=1033806 RepID=F7PLB3_9EURY|nr:hypothetical protein [Halorhabdus tiamatea]ERJ05163.1 hypothetical protein HLRTI_002833 [Halorhabdus tiamatea SARL4B]CCQ34727.1 conserved hypothetical protein [Halorhabdus tiamatea SARL4B]